MMGVSNLAGTVGAGSRFPRRTPASPDVPPEQVSALYLGPQPEIESYAPGSPQAGSWQGLVTQIRQLIEPEQRSVLQKQSGLAPPAPVKLSDEAVQENQRLSRRSYAQEVEKNPRLRNMPLVDRPAQQPSFLQAIADVYSDIGKRAAGSVMQGSASIPEGLNQGLKGTARPVLEGDPAYIMPAAVYNPMLDTESLWGPETRAEKQQRMLGVERTLEKTPQIPGARLLAQEGRALQQKINASTSKATQTAVANSQVTGNLLKGQIDFGKAPSLRGYTMQAIDAVGSALPAIAATVLTKNPLPAALVGGAMAAGDGAHAAQDFVASKSDAELQEQSPFYVDMVQAGASPEEARRLTEQRAASQAAVLQGSVGALGDGMIGKLFTRPMGRMLSKGSSLSTARELAARSVLPAAEQGIQEVAEGVAADMGTASTVASKEIGQDSAANLVMGALGSTAASHAPATHRTPNITPHAQATPGAATQPPPRPQAPGNTIDATTTAATSNTTAPAHSDTATVPNTVPNSRQDTGPAAPSTSPATPTTDQAPIAQTSPASEQAIAHDESAAEPSTPTRQPEEPAPLHPTDTTPIPLTLTDNKHFAPILQQISTLRRGDVVAQARQDGMLPPELESTSTAQAYDALSPQQRQHAAQGVLHEMVQRSPNTGYARRAMAAARNTMRELPGYRNDQWTNARIIDTYWRREPKPTDSDAPSPPPAALHKLSEHEAQPVGGWQPEGTAQAVAANHAESAGLEAPARTAQELEAPQRPEAETTATDAQVPRLAPDSAPLPIAFDAETGLNTYQSTGNFSRATLSRLALDDKTRTGEPVFRTGEGLAAAEFEGIFGARLERISKDTWPTPTPPDFRVIGGQFDGKTIDFLYTVNSPHARQKMNENFLKNTKTELLMVYNISKHTNKSDYAPMDFRALTPSNQKKLLDIINKHLTPDQRAKLLIIR